MKRLFVAIATHEGIEKAAEPILKKLRINTDQKELDVKWTPLENFHVTVVFIGNRKPEDIPEIENTLERIAGQHAPFNLKIGGMGAFPDDMKSRVMWFGVQNSKALRFLQDELTEALKLHPENEYFPHLTVARLRNPHRTKDILSPFVRKDLGKVNVTEIVLYESITATPFPIYKALKRIPLTALSLSPS